MGVSFGIKGSRELFIITKSLFLILKKSLGKVAVSDVTSNDPLLS
jgi:hypothetical protein